MSSVAFPPGRGRSLAPAGTSTGVSCDENGPSLGPVRLLRRTMFGFEPRPQAELDFVFAKTFGAPIDWRGRMPDLLEIARALDEKNLALAMIMTLHLRLPNLNEEQACRAKNAEALLKAGFNPDEPRDERGRWTSGGGVQISPAQYRPPGSGNNGNGDEFGAFPGNSNIRVHRSLSIMEVSPAEAMAQRGQVGGQSINTPDYRIFGTGPNIATGYTGFFARSGEVGVLSNGRGYIISSPSEYQLNVTSDIVNGTLVTTIEPYRGY